MSEYFLGQVITTAFGFVPRNFFPCNGQILRVNDYKKLFSVIGARYGGDGTTTFAIPDLRGRTVVGAGTSADSAWQPAPLAAGDKGGLEKVVLEAANLPGHQHALMATNSNDQSLTVRSPAGGVVGASGANQIFRSDIKNKATLAAGAVGANTAATGHENMQPFLVLSYCICHDGIMPSRA